MHLTHVLLSEAILAQPFSLYSKPVCSDYKVSIFLLFVLCFAYVLQNKCLREQSSATIDNRKLLRIYDMSMFMTVLDAL